MENQSTISPIASVLEVRALDLRYGDRLIVGDVNFSVNSGEIFAIIGGSGSGKSTLLKYLIGLFPTPEGKIRLLGQDISGDDEMALNLLRQQFGVLYQSAALWSSMTLQENVSLPLDCYRNYSDREIEDVARLKLGLVGLGGFEEFYPAEISGGMAKRAGIARAMALDPKILFLDEPSAGLDPLTSRKLDDLILELRQNLGTTVILVTHELESIFRIADRVLFLDGSTQRVLAIGAPKQLAEHSDSQLVRNFLSTKGEKCLL